LGLALLRAGLTLAAFGIEALASKKARRMSLSSSLATVWRCVLQPVERGMVARFWPGDRAQTNAGLSIHRDMVPEGSGSPQPGAPVADSISPVR